MSGVVAMAYQDQSDQTILVRTFYTSFNGKIFEYFTFSRYMKKHLLWKITLHGAVMLFQTTVTRHFSAPLITTNIDLLQLGYLGHRGLETVTAFVLTNLLGVLRGWVNVQPLIIKF